MFLLQSSSIKYITLLLCLFYETGKEFYNFDYNSLCACVCVYLYLNVGLFLSIENT